MGLEFFQTVMGHNFYEYEFPRLADAVEKLAGEVEKMNKKSVCTDEEGKIRIDFAPFSVVLEQGNSADHPTIQISLADESGNAFCDIVTITQLQDAGNKLVAVHVWGGPASDAEVCKFVVALPGENQENERKYQNG